MGSVVLLVGRFHINTDLNAAGAQLEAQLRVQTTQPMTANLRLATSDAHSARAGMRVARKQ